MNIFALSPLPYEAARFHCDKHVVKMILEYAQMLSTTHRLLDGEMRAVQLKSGKTKRVHLLHGEKTQIDSDGFLPEKIIVENSKCYMVAHANHPCSVWARETDANYHWLFQLFDGCLREYSARYQKQHSAERLKPFLSIAPSNLPRGQQTPFAQAMPEDFKHEDAIQAYRTFYIKSKSRFAKWTNTEVPKWFVNAMEGKNAADFQRTR